MRRTRIGSLRWLACALRAYGCGDSSAGLVTGELASSPSCVVCHLDQTALMGLAVEDEGGHDDAGEG